MSPHVRPLSGFKNLADQQLVTTARHPVRRPVRLSFQPRCTWHAPGLLRPSEILSPLCLRATKR